MLGDVRLRARRGAGPRPAGSRLRSALGALFPLASGNAPLDRGQRVLSVVLQGVALCVGVVVLLGRVAGIPAWDCVYAEDYGVFLVQALEHPWHLFVPYEGYFQLVPRVTGQLASLLPITAAGVVFAVTGAVIAVACALFTYHASAGFIHHRALRAVLAVALVLLPIAPLEVVGDTVNAGWYVLAALFWAVLWRPRTRAGMVLAAVIAFVAVSSDPMAIVYAPLLIMRVVALPRLREHAVTAGWLAGWVVQVPVILQSYTDHSQRLGTLAPLGKSLAYYAHTVVLRALGWHLSWHLESLAGQNGATLIVAAFLAVVFGWAVVTQGSQVRAFVVTAVLFGFVYTVFAAVITGYVVYETPYVSPLSFEPGSRYSVVPIVLLDAAAIVAVDAFLRRRAAAASGATAGAVPTAVPTAVPGAAAIRPRLRAVLAAGALVAVLAVGWVTDYRYLTQRTTNGWWGPVAASWLDSCAHSRTGTISIRAWGKPAWVTVSCSNIRR